MNRRFLLKSRPIGRVTPANFECVEEPVPLVGDGQALVRNVYLSLDPTNRIWMSDMDQYMPPVALGEVMRGGGVGQVTESRHPGYERGDIVVGFLGWQDYLLIDSQQAPSLSRMPKGLDVPLPSLLGACGGAGLTALFGLLDIGQPKPGETLVVSAAAGAVGSVAGQIGRIKGCRVVGIAGSDDKCAWLREELGFDAAVNYKAADWRQRLDAACPQGIDIDFENVGGDIMDHVLSRLNYRARVVLCGLISGYNSGERAMGSFSPLLMNRARVEGFIVSDYLPRWMEGIEQLVAWRRDGLIKSRETVVEGLEQAPTALNMLFDGENTGKLVIRICDTPIAL
jgi:NADPH-dependent curcumin reductase CurA